MLLPDERYDERHYLRDGFRAWRRYWANEYHSYFDDPIPGRKIDWATEARVVAGFLIKLVFGVAIVFFIAAIIAHGQTPQIMPYHGPSHVPAFTTTP